MHETLFKITKLYKIKDRDWMNYKITKNNSLTFHHIKEKCNGGKRIVNNGAPLTKIAHEYLNLIESKDTKLYLSLNKMFELINDGNKPITCEQRLIIEEILAYFENNIDSYQLKKPVKESYKVRG